MGCHNTPGVHHDMLQYRVYGDIYHNILSLVRFLKFSEKFSKNQNHVIWISFCQIWRYVQRFSCYLWSLCKTILCYVPFCSALNKPIFLCIVIALFTVFPTENKHIQARTLSAIHFFNGGKNNWFTTYRHLDSDITVFSRWETMWKHSHMPFSQNASCFTDISPTKFTILKG